MTVRIPGGARYIPITGSDAVSTWTLVPEAGFVSTGSDSRFRAREQRRDARKAGA